MTGDQLGNYELRPYRLLLLSFFSMGLQIPRKRDSLSWYISVIWTGLVVCFLHIYSLHMIAVCIWHWQHLWENMTLVLRNIAASVTADMYLVNRKRMWDLVAEMESFSQLLSPEKSRQLTRQVSILTLGVWFYMLLALTSTNYVVPEVPVHEYLEDHYYGSQTVNGSIAAYLLVLSDWNLSNYFAWGVLTFLIAFFLSICTSLRLNFQHFNNQFRKFVADNTRPVTATDLQLMRVLHSQLAAFVTRFDELFTRMVFIWYATIITSFCVEITALLRSDVEEMSTLAGGIFYGLRILYIVVFFIMLSVLSSLVNEEAHDVLHSLQNTICIHPTTDHPYNIQAELLVTQLNSSVVGLSAWNVFIINRGFMLTVLGAVISYGVLIIQLNPKAMKKLSGITS
ncbi:uncharacterized protein LOC143227265 [Tachypleus tridentatus]|uniref:uncharacterized protein LOC143227265 n=1 Tax=Tachypleus tridentatus TaxID=6853 RepID=UPI003FD398A9